MTIVDALWLVGLIAGMVGIAFIEQGVDPKMTPHGRLRAYVLWSVSGAAAASFVMTMLGNGWDSALVAGLLFGPVCQPLAIAYQTASDWWHSMRPYAYSLHGQRWPTRSWSGRPPPYRHSAPTNPDDAWMDSALWRRGREPQVVVVTPPPPPPRPEPRPPTKGMLRAQLGLTVLAAVLWPVFTVSADQARDPARREKVAAYVEALGFEAPSVQRGLTSAPCWGGAEYDWRSEAGDGRACVRGDDVTAFVEVDRTSKDPFARPAP